MSLNQNYRHVRERIAAACVRVGRDAAAVRVVAIAKGHPPETIAAAAELGLDVFGENRVQEAKAKIPRCPARLRWHMVGHLQTNKCRDAVSLFDMVHSVDSLRLAQELDRWAERLSRELPILLEVNVAGEATKFGYPPDRLLSELASLNACRRLQIHGLMAMAPWSPEPEKARPVFRRLRELKASCESILGAPLPHLSMGMSDDFEIAIEEGATLVRIGTALFGPRPAATWTAAPDR